MKKEYKIFKNNLSKARTEEDVKNAYAKHFKINYDTSDRHDLYTPQVLFEFKYDKNFENLKAKATIFAQILYYVRQLKYGFTNKAIPIFLCLADKNETIITETIKWKKYYTNDDNYDWDIAPSMPDCRLVEKLIDDNEFRNLHIYRFDNETNYNIFHEKLIYCLEPQHQSELIDKKIITEENFEEVFEFWNDTFGDSVQNGFKTSKYFVCDIQKGRTYPIKEEGKIFFDFGDGDSKMKKILLKDYDFFWQLYEKVNNPEIIRGILSKIDRLTEENMRRFHGEFFTPLRFANKALNYIEETAGKEWWKTGEYRIWDMAAGTGNLEWYLPNESYQYLYLSTLYLSDVDHCKKLFPSATVFQYDYLNDDVANVFANNLNFDFTWKLPEKLRNDLANPELKWIILINPPFATSQKAGTSGQSKQDVSDTNVRKVMHKDNLGEVSRELFAQFIFRIKKEFENKRALFGLFSTMKYINSNNDQKFRDDVFMFSFKDGFIFSSANFAGTKKNNAFPVSFMLWDLSKAQKLEAQSIRIKILNSNIEKIGYKIINSENRDMFLSKWIKRPTAINKFPPIGSAISLKTNNKDRRDRIANGFLASLMCKGNDFQNQNFTALLSAPYVSAGALSVTPENFVQSMIIHAVRRIPKATWINDRDQFLQPKQDLSKEFINDCTMWNLFSNSNQTASMKDVEYEDELYQINNHFFPFLLSEIKTWGISDSDISLALTSAEDRFLAKWLINKEFSIEAKEVLNIGKEIYQFYFKNLPLLQTHLFKIQTWDAGFWQIRNVLKDQDLAVDLFVKLKEKHIILGNKILPQIYDNKFISKIENI